MHHRFSIQFLKNNKIDRQKWDACVTNSSNRLIYALTFFLDKIAPGWNALAGDDYEWVLPLTNKNKYGITYLYQPPFTQQLGVFSKPGVIVPYKEIINYLQKHYRFWEINWNYSAPRHLADPAIQMNDATNFILDLTPGYQTIAAGYHTDLTKNLKRSKRFHLVCRATSDYHKCIQTYRKYYGKQLSHVKESDYQNFMLICSYSALNDMIICKEVVNEDNELMALALLLFDGKRIYNLMNTTTEAGRKTAANHFLLDDVIKEFSGQEIVLDFEGSDLPGVKTFYENFGAVNQPYFMLKYNNLPKLLKIFKN